MRVDLSAWVAVLSEHQSGVFPHPGSPALLSEKSGALIVLPLQKIVEHLQGSPAGFLGGEINRECFIGHECAAAAAATIALRPFHLRIGGQLNAGFFLTFADWEPAFRQL